MAFASAVLDQTVEGNKRVVTGTYTGSGGGTGGDIATGLSRVDFISLQPGGASAFALAPVVNETLPLANGGAVTIVTNANETGYWRAEGV